MIQIDRLEGRDRVRVMVQEGDSQYQVEMESPDISRALVQIKEIALGHVYAALEKANKEHVADLLSQRAAERAFSELRHDARKEGEDV